MSTCLQPLCAQISPQIRQLIATDANTIYVSTADELLAIATNNDTNNGYSGKTIVVTNDITFSGSWTSIGTETVPFVGTFNGGLHNIKITCTDYSFYGLFKYVGAGASILGVNIDSEKTDGEIHGFEAGLVYTATGTASNSVKIKNCVNRGQVCWLNLTPGRGGIVGEAKYVDIDSCANFGKICDRYNGGIVGRSNGGVYVNNCYNFANIIASFDGFSVNGIGGNVVTNSYCIADLDVYNEDGSTPREITDGTSTNCYFKGTLTYDGRTVTARNCTVVTDGEDLYEKATTAGWDFENTWIYDDTHNINGYPELRAFYKEIVVDIDLNGGTYDGSKTISNEKFNTTCTLPTTITKTGYTFNGYIVTSGDGTGSVSGNTYTFGDADGTVQVQWTVISYTITYNLGNGSMSGQKTTYTIESETFTLPTPTKADYIFLGWTGSNGTTPQTSVEVTKGTYGNLSYTANWRPDVVTITISVTVNNDRAYIVYMLDENDNVTRQFVVTNGTEINIELAKGVTFALQVYETLYLTSKIDDTETRYAKYENVTDETLNITITLSGVTNVNNWLVV